MFLRLLFILLMLLPSPLLARERLVVFAAASQTDVMNEIGEVFEETCGCDVVFSFAASSLLARQIDAGAKADIFISASTEWVNWLENREKISASKPFIGNRLVIISRKEILTPRETLSAGRFSMADPRSVPAGVYAREALTNLKIWGDVQPNAIYTENVRIALKLVMRGDIKAGIVYQSDVNQLPGKSDVSQLVFPEKTHSRIEYVAGRTSDNNTAKEFIAFLTSDNAQKLFERFGFIELSAK